MGLLDYLAAPQHPDPYSMEGARSAGVNEGLLRMGAALAQAGAPAPPGHFRPGWGQALSGGLLAYQQGNREGRQGYIQNAQAEQEMARHQAINEALKGILAQPEVAKAFESQGMTPQHSTPQAFQALIEADARRWGTLIRTQGITAE